MMTKLFRKGLTVGKYCPLTLGHEWLINQAAEQCEQLIVLSYAKPNYGYNAFLRNYWLNCVIDRPNVEFYILDEYCPHNNSDEIDHRKFCADYLFNELETTVDCVFSSESYGPGFAQYLQDYFNSKLLYKSTVHHVMVDLHRKTHDISATRVRNKILDYKQATSNIVSQTLVPRILFLGGESSGKTTLCRELSSKTGYSWVEEYGRTLYEELNGFLQYSDFIDIAEKQIHLELTTAKYSDKMLFCDTNVTTTYWYCKNLCGTIPHRLSKLLGDTKDLYNSVFVCDPNIDFYQDGTRQDSAFRQKAHEFYLDFLKNNNISYEIVYGSLESRINQVCNKLVL